MSVLEAIREVIGPLTGGLLGKSQESSKTYEPTPLKAMREITNVQSFSAILPYTAYFEDEAFFVLETGERDKKELKDGLGFVIEVDPQSGADTEMIDVLLPLFSSPAAGTNLQVSLYGSPDIVSTLRTSALMCTTPGDDPENQDPTDARNQSIFRVLARKRATFLLKASKDRAIPHLPVLVRNLRAIISVMVPCDPKSTKAHEDLGRLRDGMHATLASANFASRDWDAADLINWCSDLTNPNTLYSKNSPAKKSYDSGKLIKHQIVNPNTICRPTDDGKSLAYGLPGAHDEVTSRLYTVTGYPEEFPLWAMGNLIGDFYQGQLGYPCPFVITMGIHVLEAASNKSAAQLKGARATTNAESPMAKFLPDFQEKKRDWDVVNKSYKDGLGEVDMYHQVLLIDRPSNIDASENSVRAIWRSRAFALVEQRYLQVPGILTTLPLGFTSSMHQFYKRSGVVHRKVTRNAVNMAPLLGEWKGTTTPVVQLVGRRGQLMSFSMFDNTGGNYNFAITGASGSGKSVLGNSIIVGYRATGARVFVLDVGGSYEKVCNFLGGQFIQFKPQKDGRLSINPLNLVVDIVEDMAILKPLLEQMASPSGTLTEYDRSLLERAIRAAWEAKGKLAEITDIAEVLTQDADPIAQRLGSQLFPYTKNGMYGHYFEGEATINFDNDFVVLELEELKSKKDLQSVVLCIMMFKITQAMYLDDRSRRKLCVIDEAWDLLSGVSSGKFIEEMYRRARKYNAAVGTLTQNSMDYYKSPATQACIDNADTVFLLKQKKESIEQLEKAGRLPVDSNSKRLLASIKTEQGFYSEIFITSPAGTGVGRLMVDPFTLLLYSSSPDDWAAIQSYRRQGQTVAQSIDSVLNDRGIES